MEFIKFKKIIDGMKERVIWEDKAYQLGINLVETPNDPYDWVMRLFDEIYPHSVGDVEYFCWELNFGEYFTPGCVVDEDGRECDFSSVEALWTYLEDREKRVEKI